MKELNVHAVAGTIDGKIIKVTSKNIAKINMPEKKAVKQNTEMKKEVIKPEIKETKTLKDRAEESII